MEIKNGKGSKIAASIDIERSAPKLITIGINYGSLLIVNCSAALGICMNIFVIFLK